MPDDLFPAFVKIRGRRCVVVGGGQVAEAKIASLVRCGADVCVVAPEATLKIREAAERGEIRWEARRFRQEDLQGAFLAVAATSSEELHREIFALARERGVLCNCVDEPERCDFYYPAVVRRGPLQIAVSTSGRAPMIAQRIRMELEERFGPEYGEWVQQTGSVRAAMLANGLPEDGRRELLRELCGAGPGGWPIGLAEKGAGGCGKVFLIGAGPGDPELLTRKAWACLQRADVVLHDALVPEKIVRLAGRGALVIDTGKRCGKKSASQEEINEMMISQARSGKLVVRLKGGDPLVFGRAGEEIRALKQAGIEFEIVPGVTAASAAAAAAQMTLTDRHIAPELILVSAHRCKDNQGPEWKRLANGSATLAVYMPGGKYKQIAQELRDAGLDGGTPCVIVSRALLPDQIISRRTLHSLAEAPEPPSPAIILIGEAARADEAVIACRENPGEELRVS